MIRRIRLVENYLIEGRNELFDLIKKKDINGVLTQENFDTIVNEIDKIGGSGTPYAKWILLYYVGLDKEKARLFMEDFDKLIGSLQTYEKFKKEDSVKQKLNSIYKVTET